MIQTKTAIPVVLEPMKPNETTSVVVKGVISDATWFNNFTELNVNFEYFYELEGQRKTIKHGSYKMDKETIDDMDSMIEEVGNGKCEKEANLFYVAFMSVMSETYGISISNIEIV